MPGEAPLFEMNDANMFPPVNPPEGLDPESRFWQEVNDKADKMGISINEARRRTGWPPDWPYGAELCRAVLDGAFDHKAL